MSDKIDKLILECISINDQRAAPARKYILSRGLDPNYLTQSPNGIMFHQSLPYYDDDGKWIGSHPALVAFCRIANKADSKIEAAMRIYLTDDGNKAPLAPCKKAIGTISGTSCLIGDVSEEVIVGEGFETTLAASQATGLSAFVTMMASNLECFDPPPGVSTVHILVDKDKSGRGESASNALALKLCDLGIEVFLHIPKAEISDGQKGIDWADEFVNKGAEYVRDEIRRAAPFILSNTDTNLVQMSEVEREEVEWLLKPYMPRRKVTFLEGDPGLGKSFITLNIASSISTGRTIVDDLKIPKGKVVLFCSEDGLGDTVRPRLEKMEADLTQISAYKIPIVLDDEGKKAIENALRTQRPDLVILDPLSAFLSTSMDINKANHARQFMSWLAQASDRFNCAILIIRHLTKGGRDQAIYRGLGSIDFTAAARSVMMVAASPSDKSKRAIFHTKSNLAAFGNPLGYKIDDGQIVWTGAPTFKLEDYLNPAPPRSSSGPTAQKEAAEFLKKFLAGGAKKHDEVVEHMKQELAVSTRTLARAKSALKVESFKEQGVENGPWLWRLPAGPVVQDFTESTYDRFEDEDLENDY